MVNHTVCLACRGRYDISKNLFVCKKCLLGGGKYNRDGCKVTSNWEATKFKSSSSKFVNFLQPPPHSDNIIPVNMPVFQYFRPSKNLKLEIRSVEFSCHECEVVFENENELRSHQVFVHSDFHPSKSVKCSFTFNIVDNSDKASQLKFKPESKRVNGDVPSSKYVSSHKQVSGNTHIDQSLDDIFMDDYNESTDATNADWFESDSKNCFQCDECNKAYEHGDSLDQHHYLFDNPLEEKTPKVITCGRCKYVSISSFDDLESHLKRVHCDYRNFECPTCFVLMKTLADLTEHQKENGCEVRSVYTKNINLDDGENIPVDNIGKVDPTQVKEFKCHICGAEFAHPQSMEFHIKCQHKKIKDFVCPICSRAFFGRGHLNQHIDSFHYKLKNFPCPLCSFKAFTKVQRATHIRIVHEKERQFRCDLCSKAYACKWSLDHHVKSFHNKIFDFMCNICAKSFSCKRRLMLHIRKVHEKIQDYKCTHCKKAFDNKDILKEHLKVDHDGAANYQCPYCAMTTLFHVSLKKHMSNVHEKRGQEVKMEDDKVVNNDSPNLGTDMTMVKFELESSSPPFSRESQTHLVLNP